MMTENHHWNTTVIIVQATDAKISGWKFKEKQEICIVSNSGETQLTPQVIEINSTCNKTCAFRFDTQRRAHNFSGILVKNE